MVREGHGDSIYVERLKSKSIDDVAQMAVWDHRSAAEQLGIAATEHDYQEFLHNQHVARGSLDEPDCSMHDHGERISAVAAAIETVTGKSSSGRSTPRSMTKSPIVVNETQSPRSNTVPYKENWFPKQRLEQKMMNHNYTMYDHSMHHPIDSSGYSPAIMAVGPSPTLSYTHMTQSQQGVVSTSSMPTHYDYSSAILQEPIQADPSPYFQTQSGFPFKKSDNESKIDRTPYYECNSREVIKSTPLGGNGDISEHSIPGQVR